MVQLLAAFSEFERAQIRERVAAGRPHANFFFTINALELVGS
jgi:hypothetical protein